MAVSMEHLGREQEIAAAGRTWKLARLDRAIWRQWLDWAKEQLPDPVEEALKIIDRLPEKVASSIVRQALDEKTSHLSLGSPKVNKLMNSPEGVTRLLYLLLRRDQKDATEDDAMDIIVEIGQERAKEFFDQAAGTAPRSGNP